MPTPSSLFASAIPISSLKLAGIKHPPPHPFSSHSFSIPLPHLHGVSRVHAILHSFTYPLKPLTQVSISMQSTKPVSLSKLSPTCGILPKKCHMALSPLHTQTVPLSTRGMAHPTRERILSDRRPTFSGCFTSRILSADIPPSPDVSHPKLCPADVPPSLDISHPTPDAGQERRAIQLPRSDMSGSFDSAYPESIQPTIQIPRTAWLVRYS